MRALLLMAKKSISQGDNDEDREDRPEQRRSDFIDLCRSAVE